MAPAGLLQTVGCIPADAHPRHSRESGNPVWKHREFLQEWMVGWILLLDRDVIEGLLAMQAGAEGELNRRA